MANGCALVTCPLIILQAAAPNRFPTFCGVLIGGSTLLQIPIGSLLNAINAQFRSRKWRTASQQDVTRLVRFLAALLSAWVGFELLNSGETRPLRTDSVTVRGEKAAKGNSQEDDSSKTSKDGGDAYVPPALPLEALGADVDALSSSPLAGKTIDLTLFAFTHALSVLGTLIWLQTSPHRSYTQRLAKFVPAALFSLSSATIMHAWFYNPYRLPRSYRTWISAAAELDTRLLEALRQARYGNWQYGKDTGMARLLGDMCHDHNLPEVWGDPAKTCPIPCELVHQGSGPSCELHALHRFARGWLFAARMYFPLQTLVLLRKLQKMKNGSERRAKAPAAITAAAMDAATSSSFLGAFISLFYYGVCLARTRIGARVVPANHVSPQMWDAGLCVTAGCAACGWSVLLEPASRQQEICLFVLPRAMAVWAPRRYLRQNRWKEELAFVLSAATVLTAAQDSPELVRGVFGKLLARLLTQ